MPSHNRRAAGRRRAWGRGPIILKLESLERRELLTAAGSTLPDLVNSSLVTAKSVSDWSGTLEVEGRVKNQGGSTTTAPFEITLYASPVRGINRYSVPIAEVMIPAGLAPGTSVPYDSSVTLPATPIPTLSNSTVYINAVVNPGHTVAESNYHNNEDLGPPYDSVPVLIQATVPAHLVGTTLAVTPSDPTWGSTITVTAQITNQSSGSSPQTRALIALTPQGLTYGSSTTFGIGNIIVPPLGPYQTVNLVQNITLPAVEPSAIANYTNFGLTMTQDADYVTDDLYPHQPDQGTGLDQTSISITTSSTSTATLGSLPDLAASSVLLSKTSVQWGSTVKATTEIQNLGLGAAPSSQVFFILTGQSGSLTDAIFLGETTLPALAPGASQDVSQTLQIPSRLPAGVTLNAVGYGRIEVLTNPDNFIGESLYTNGGALSQPFILRLPGDATTVPTAQAAGTLPSVEALAIQSHNKARVAAAEKLAANAAGLHARKPVRKLHRKLGKGGLNIAKTGLNVAQEIYKLPTQAFDAIKRSL
jgi:hypothetical protein